MGKKTYERTPYVTLVRVAVRFYFAVYFYYFRDNCQRNRHSIKQHADHFGYRYTEANTTPRTKRFNVFIQLQHAVGFRSVVRLINCGWGGKTFETGTRQTRFVLRFRFCGNSISFLYTERSEIASPHIF